MSMLWCAVLVSYDLSFWFTLFLYSNSPPETVADNGEDTYLCRLVRQSVPSLVRRDSQGYNGHLGIVPCLPLCS